MRISDWSSDMCSSDLFDRTLLDSPLVAELRTPSGDVVVRDLFDHDRFRHDLRADQEAGGRVLRGVLVLTGGELPPPHVRLAFLPGSVSGTAGTTLAVVRTDVPRSEERRVGNGCVRTCRSRWAPYH